MPVIIWINGGFGAGKTTLAEELHRRLPDAVVYDPEDVGLMLWKWMRPNGDFQHLPSWRELVVATALSLGRRHAKTLIVPMSLIRDAYGTSAAWPTRAKRSCTCSWRRAPGVCRERLNAHVVHPGKGRRQAARELGMTGVDEMVIPLPASRAGPSCSLDRLTQAELADKGVVDSRVPPGSRR